MDEGYCQEPGRCKRPTEPLRSGAIMIVRMRTDDTDATGFVKERISEATFRIHATCFDPRRHVAVTRDVPATLPSHSVDQ
jgi:hypothetical protein